MTDSRLPPPPFGDFKSTLERWSTKQTRPIVPIDWIVENMIAAGDITVLFSDSGIGKSWKAAHIALQVVSGGMVDGLFKTSKGNVLWYDNENGPDENNRRCQLLDRGKGFSEVEVRFKEADVYFQERYWNADEAGLTQLRDEIDQVKPILVVFDSLVSFLPAGTDENDASAIRKVMNDISSILRFNRDGTPRERGIGCLVLHHAKKGSDDDGWPVYRGSGDIRAACSFMFPMREKKFEDKEGNKHSRIQFKFDKVRRGRKDKEVYEYELVDHDEGSFRHWVEYRAYGKATSYQDRVTDMVVRALTGFEKELTVREIQETWDGFPEDDGSMRRVLREMVEKGIILTKVGKNRQNYYLLKI